MSERWQFVSRSGSPASRYSDEPEQSSVALLESRGSLRRRSRYWSELGDLSAGAGSPHPLMALSLNNLAVLYKDQGKFTQAEPLYERALSNS